jgi:hypothetical protein
MDSVHAANRALLGTDKLRLMTVSSQINDIRNATHVALVQCEDAVEVFAIADVDRQKEIDILIDYLKRRDGGATPFTLLGIYKNERYLGFIIDKQFAK